MTAQKFLTNNGGVITELAATETGGSGTYADKIPALDASGKLDASMMPSGIGADTVTATASEALSAGAWVNLYNNSGALGARNADCSGAGAGKIAHGYVLAAVSSSGTATVYLTGINTAVTGLTIGPTFLGTAGATSSAAPTTSGYAVQRLGVALSATSAQFEAHQPIVLA